MNMNESFCGNDFPLDDSSHLSKSYRLLWQLRQDNTVLYLATGPPWLCEWYFLLAFICVIIYKNRVFRALRFDANF